MVGPPETLKAQPTQPSWGWAYNATAGAISARLFGMKCDFFVTSPRWKKSDSVAPFWLQLKIPRLRAEKRKFLLRDRKNILPSIDVSGSYLIYQVAPPHTKEKSYTRP